VADEEARWITESEVVDLVSLREAIAALERGLKEEHAGQAVNMNKTHAAWNRKRSTLHAIGAVLEGMGIAGTKTWVHTPAGACPLLILFNSENGRLMAVIEAFALGQMRTAGISGVATRALAHEKADEMAIVGTGRQALAQVAGVHAVRPLKRLRVYSPNPEHRKVFVDKVRSQFSFDVTATNSVQQAVEGVPIVTLVTRATEPFLSSAMLASDCHVNAVGAITPQRQEFAQDVLERSTRIVVDNLDSVRRLSREFIEQFGDDDNKWRVVQPLSAVVAAGGGRPPGADMTLFKAMGMGLSDLALAQTILDRTYSRGAGREIPQPKKQPLRFF
jgi:ornithine cyclodeaminase